MGDEILVREMLSYFLAKIQLIPGIDTHSRLIALPLGTIRCVIGISLLLGNSNARLSTSSGSKSLRKNSVGVSTPEAHF